MTVQRSFKRLVRARMEKTGESYTAARTQLLAAEVVPDAPALPWPDARVRERTGRGWEEWFDAIDAWGGMERTHREIARWAAAEQDVHPLSWNAQAVARGYELARGLKVPGEREDGFAITASKTVGVPVERLFDAVVSGRERWLPEADLVPRSATPPKVAHFDWGSGSRVHVHLAPKGDGRAVVSVTHERLADAAEAERMKAFWRERVSTLKAVLEA